MDLSDWIKRGHKWFRMCKACRGNGLIPHYCLKDDTVNRHPYKEGRQVYVDHPANMVRDLWEGPCGTDSEAEYCGFLTRCQICNRYWFIQWHKHPEAGMVMVDPLDVGSRKPVKSWKPTVSAARKGPPSGTEQ